MADIGLGGHDAGRPARLVAPPDRAALDKGRVAGAHKFGHGHALVLPAGPARAVRLRWLAARAALSVGAGLVSLAPTPGALQENAARLDAVMLNPLADAASLARVLDDARITALCLGPGSVSNAPAISCRWR
ncbi:MAG: hypothetical protein R3D59_17910 [Paracoccaceae bacterium]